MTPSKIRISLLVDKKTYKKYRRFCDKYGLQASRRFELFMKHELQRSLLDVFNLPK